MNITYLRPLPLPSTVRVESRVIQMGRSMSLVRGNITSQSSDKVYFTCEHHKANGSGPIRAATTVEGVKAKL